MPTHIRAQIAVQADTMLPRDAVQITPHFRHQNVLPGDDPNWQTLADDLVGVITAWKVDALTSQVTVKLYDVEQPPINRPKAISVANAGLAKESIVPREVALCLSFYGGNNEPHNRGRLYLPFMWLLGSGAPDVRPSSAVRDKAGDLVDGLAGLGGLDVDWIVWSPTRAAATKVEHWFVDDEYDTVRRRGLRPEARTTGTTGG